MSFEGWIIAKADLRGQLWGTKLWENLEPIVAITLCLEEPGLWRLLKRREPCGGIMSLIFTFCLWSQGTSWGDPLAKQGSLDQAVWVLGRHTGPCLLFSLPTSSLLLHHPQGELTQQAGRMGPASQMPSHPSSYSQWGSHVRAIESGVQVPLPGT